MNAKIIYNRNSQTQAENLEKKLRQKNIKIVKSNPDVVFIIGGDGRFLRGVRDNRYSKRPIYIGINRGTLGYFQNVEIHEVDKVIDYLLSNRKYNTSKIALAKIEYVFNDGKIKKDFAINELQISGRHFHKIGFELSDNMELVEEITSSGIVFSTPLGSTACNKSLGGPVICQGIDVLCATLIAPIQNSVTKDYISNSLVSNNFKFTVLTKPSDVEIIIDGQAIYMNMAEVSHINVEIEPNGIRKLNMENKSYSQNMIDKMLKGNS